MTMGSRVIQRLPFLILIAELSLQVLIVWVQADNNIQ